MRRAYVVTALVFFATWAALCVLVFEPAVVPRVIAAAWISVVITASGLVTIGAVTVLGDDGGEDD